MPSMNERTLPGTFEDYTGGVFSDITGRSRSRPGISQSVWYEHWNAWKLHGPCVINGELIGEKIVLSVFALAPTTFQPNLVFFSTREIGLVSVRLVELVLIKRGGTVVPPRVNRNYLNQKPCSFSWRITPISWTTTWIGRAFTKDPTTGWRCLTWVASGTQWLAAESTKRWSAITSTKITWTRMQSR